MDLSRAAWRKSSRSEGNGGACVEVAPVERIIAIRDSKNSSGPALAFGPDAWKSFLAAVKGGALDI